VSREREETKLNHFFSSENDARMGPARKDEAMMLMMMPPFSPRDDDDNTPGTY
jgi:hypothetical protein